MTRLFPASTGVSIGFEKRRVGLKRCIDCWNKWMGPDASFLWSTEMKIFLDKFDKSV